jgi:hypothetical protein
LVLLNHLASCCLNAGDDKISQGSARPAIAV